MPRGWKPGWDEGACSAGGDGAGVCAVAEYSEQVALSLGLIPKIQVDQLGDPGKPWDQAACAAHFERPVVPGADAGLPLG